MKNLNDTIAAISTPIGVGGIGIIRISGKDAIPIAETLFKPKRNIKLSDVDSHTIHYGFIRDPKTNEIFDEVLLTVMWAPKTYTKEDIVEINCHGGYLTLSKILNLLLKNGIRLAEPGEFTLRAFLNGRIDLTRAEAVMDLITAKSEAAMRLAMRHLQGQLNDILSDLENKLLDIVSLYEAHVDFPEEDLDGNDLKNVLDTIEDLIQNLNRLSEGFHYSRLIKEGVGVCIIGAPNVGKSSLLNKLLLKDRAIVTPIPGTTRDVIEDSLEINGLPVRIIDTAGIRDTDDIIEKEGIKRTRMAVELADIVIVVCDISKGISQEDLLMIEQTRGKKTIIAINKVDLTGLDLARQKTNFLSNHEVCYISALNGFGISGLKDVIFKIAVGNMVKTDAIISNERHKHLIDMTSKALHNVVQEIRQDSPIDIILIPLREGLLYLGEITGRVISDEAILDRIFSKFCIGK
ncbi:MAG: tRNA uridine-5-carboxymethylaminomethyl(34) synthesis GTPase MnmE [Thermodesulfovibrionales bacterium]|nr:tRNA uridine-5-carboxymethylaminomethyl(34) synthesis GTPase MnmE [Thermodesulfovibrionales bacterium]